MAQFPTLTKNNLSDFSGRALVKYRGNYADTAIKQATLLFKLGTCLTEFPEDGTPQAELATYGLLAMADAIVLVQRYQEALANPFSSETIGSYSYSKAATAVNSGLPTGITWFDLAVEKLGVCTVEPGSEIMSGGIEVFEYDGAFGASLDSRFRVLGPADLNLSRAWGWDPAPADGSAY